MNNESQGEGDKSSLLRASSRGERLHWRPWPCAKCSEGITPIGFLVTSLEASASFREDEPEQLAVSQVATLLCWVEGCRHNLENTINLPLLAEGSEHKVFLNEENAQVYKVTRPLTYGESYYLVDGIVHQRNCSPLDYLIRLRLWEKLFRSAPRDLGMTKSGQIVSVQKYISGTLPPQSSVDEFLSTSGLSAVKQSCWLWKKAYPEFEIWMGDARDENFVETNAGIVPIDIRVWISSPVE